MRREDGERLAREYNVAFMETSAKSGQNVELAFLAIARELKQRQSGQRDADAIKFSVQDYVREHTHKQPCPPCITWIIIVYSSPYLYYIYNIESYLL